MTLRRLTPALILATAACAGSGSEPPQPTTEVIAPADVEPTGPPFSPGIRAGDFIYLSGAIGIRPGTLELVSGSLAAQTSQALRNLEAVLEAAGSGLEDVVKCTVFLVDMRDYAAMNEVYGDVWPGDPPARSTVAGDGLALGARVEIECIAYDPA